MNLLVYLLLVLSTVVCAYKTWPTESLVALKTHHKDDTWTQRLLEPLLIPRVSGTPGNEQVREFIKDHFGSLGTWHVEEDAFTEATPVFGSTRFHNVIATYDIDAPKRLVLAAHYDSKFFEDFEFVGATDSAVPCAILMRVAEVLEDLLKQKKTQTTLQLVFFDGEEAFVSWSESDSIYGARHLAAQWQVTGDLDRIGTFVLLDLLGAASPKIPNYHSSTSWLFRKLMRLEKVLTKNQTIFDENSIMTFRGYLMQDDHVPFLQRGVDVLHVIPYPFPPVWHEASDNKDIIELPIVQAFTDIFCAMVVEYLELNPLQHHIEL